MSAADELRIPPPPSAAMILTLGGVATLSGLLVVLVVQLTTPFIEENQRIAIERAVFQVIPGAVERRDWMLTRDGPLPVEQADPDMGEKIYVGHDAEGAFKGVAMVAEAPGYQDVIRILYGFNPDCSCITGIKVLRMTETPGLGDKIAFDPAFLKNFEALDARLNDDKSALANAIVTVKSGTKSQPWQIDAISGATVSSKAIGRMLNESAQRTAPLIHKFRAELEGS